METKDEGGGGICLVPRDKGTCLGGGGGMCALTYYMAHQGSRSPAHLIKLDNFIALLGITLRLKSL